MEATTHIELRIADEVATLWLQPPAETKPPTLDGTVLAELEQAIARVAEAARQGRVRLLWVRSGSAKFFCAGANLALLRAVTAETIEAWVRDGHRVLAGLEDLPVPVVARVEGYALGGGLELALACDLMFAATTAQLGQTEAKLGFVAGWGGSWRLPRRVGLARAKELFFSARLVAAEEAARLGLVDFCGDAAALEVQCAQFAAAVRAGSAVSHAGHKALLRQAAQWTREESAAGEASASAECLRSGDTQARLQAFFARSKGGA